MKVCDTSLFKAGEEAVSHETALFGSYWTFHRLGLWIAAGFALVASGIAFILIFLHATHYSRPQEQRNIIRILLMIPIYSTVSFLSYRFYKYSIYWETVRDCYEAFAIASFFHLLSFYLEPTLHEQKQYFRSIKPKNWVLPLNWFQPCTGGQNKGLFRIPRSGLTWFNIIWIGVFQYCLIRVFFTFVALISALLGRYCEESLNPVFAHVWVMGFDAIGVTIAMYCLIQFYVQLREDLSPNKPFLKVCCIKLVIFFSFWQNLLISFLSSGEKPVIKTGPTISYVDVKVGIPSVLLCIEMALFSILHIFAFPWKGYDISDSGNPNDYYRGGFLGLKALLDAFNPMDFIRATARGFKWLFVGVRRREEDESYKHVVREPGTLTSGAKISGPYPLSPSDMDDEYPKPMMVAGVGENIELMGHGPPKRHNTTDEFSDHTALLSHPQRMPLSPSGGTSPEAHPLYPVGPGDRSNTSTPPIYPPGGVSPGLAPMQLRDPIGRIDSPPSPMEERVLAAGTNVGASMDSRVRPRGPGSAARGPAPYGPPYPQQGMMMPGTEYSRGDGNRRDRPPQQQEQPPPPHGYGQAF